MSDLTLANGSLSPLGSAFLSSVNPAFRGLAYGNTASTPSLADPATLTALLSGTGDVGAGGVGGGGGKGIGTNGAYPTTPALAGLLGVSPNVTGVAGSLARSAMGPLGMVLGGINTVGNIANTDMNTDALNAMGAAVTTGQQLGGYIGSNTLAGSLDQAISAMNAGQKSDMMTFGSNLPAALATAAMNDHGTGDITGFGPFSAADMAAGMASDPGAGPNGYGAPPVSNGAGMAADAAAEAAGAAGDPSGGYGGGYGNGQGDPGGGGFFADGGLVKSSRNVTDLLRDDRNMSADLLSAMSDPYTTALTPNEEHQFQSWSRQKGYDPALETEDYDLRGAWKGGASQSDNGHLTDQYKKPWHPTFSDQSQYNGITGEDGGKWTEDGNGDWSFTPGAANMRYWPPDKLRDYFQRIEPNVQLRMDGYAHGGLVTREQEGPFAWWVDQRMVHPFRPFVSRDPEPESTDVWQDRPDYLTGTSEYADGGLVEHSPEGKRVRSDPAPLSDNPLSPLNNVYAGGAYSSPYVMGNATAMDPEAMGALTMMRRQTGAPSITPEREQELHDLAIMLGLRRIR